MVVVLLLIGVFYQMTPGGKAAIARREKQEADRATYHGETEARQRDPGDSGNADIGETMGIVDGHGFWPCGSSTRA
ncbi:MAG TPA: hypothetical protein VMH05_18285, partial [Bryobacteraceae bacterium]|nr:hypothetical protein [Bryobacteraceae bacterium]